VLFDKIASVGLFGIYILALEIASPGNRHTFVSYGQLMRAKIAQNNDA